MCKKWFAIGMKMHDRLQTVMHFYTFIKIIYRKALNNKVPLIYSHSGMSVQRDDGYCMVQG